MCSRMAGGMCWGGILAVTLVAFYHFHAAGKYWWTANTTPDLGRTLDENPIEKVINGRETAYCSPKVILPNPHHPRCHYQTGVSSGMHLKIKPLLCLPDGRVKLGHEEMNAVCAQVLRSLVLSQSCHSFLGIFVGGWKGETAWNGSWGRYPEVGAVS